MKPWIILLKITVSCCCNCMSLISFWASSHTYWRERANSTSLLGAPILFRVLSEIAFFFFFFIFSPGVISLCHYRFTTSILLSSFQYFCPFKRSLYKYRLQHLDSSFQFTATMWLFNEICASIYSWIIFITSPKWLPRERVKNLKRREAAKIKDEKQNCEK